MLALRYLMLMFYNKATAWLLRLNKYPLRITLILVPLSLTSVRHCLLQGATGHRVHVRSAWHPGHSRPAAPPNRLAESQVHQRNQRFVDSWIVLTNVCLKCVHTKNCNECVSYVLKQSGEMIFMETLYWEEVHLNKITDRWQEVWQVTHKIQ